MVRPILVTGLGVVSPLGRGAEENWKNLTEPSSGLRPSARRLADPVCGPLPLGEGARRAGEGLARAQELSSLAAIEALSGAGLWNGQDLQNIDPERIGCTFSASKPLFDDDCPMAPDVINNFVSNQFGLQGERRNVIAACATGAHSIALGASWIEQDLCDVVVAGSVEPYPHPLIQSGFRQMGVTSSENVTRPFDLQRSGFTFGEGSGVVVLESEKSAHRRGANIQGRLTGWALGADGHSPVAFNSNGARIADVITRALKHGELSASDVDHVNAHGTGTRLNDWIETQALIKAFGPKADRLMISATKASTGHLLGASGSIEFIFTLLALRNQFVPPTRTLQTPDPECSLDYTAKTGHTAKIRHGLSLSFGFGGPIGVLLASPC